MPLSYRLIRPILFRLNPEWAHHLTLNGIRVAHSAELSILYAHPLVRDPVELGDRDVVVALKVIGEANLVARLGRIRVKRQTGTELVQRGKRVSLREMGGAQGIMGFRRGL